MMAPSPISQFRTFKVGVTPVLGRAIADRSPRVSIPNRTVATIRAQDRPPRFAHAIQIHKPMPRRPKNPANTSPTVTAVLTWLVVSDGEFARMTLFRLLMVSRPTMNDTALTPAPAYMSLTALSTDCGGSGRCGAGPCPADGYD